MKFLLLGALGIGTLILVASCKKKDDEADLGPCVADAMEPNNSVAEMKSLGAVNDDDDVNLPIVGGDAKASGPIRKALTLHDGADVDWFVAAINDTGLGGSPKLSVIVSSNVVATAWFACNSGATSVVCGLGTKVTDDPDHPGQGCTTPAPTTTSVNTNIMIECDGTSDESGNLVVRVKRLTPSMECARYDLSIFVD